MCSLRKLCNNNECNDCFEKSFASHEKSTFWSDQNKIIPRQVFRFSNKKYWFKCQCGHNFESVIANITGSNQWCPYCANHKICDNDNCAFCFEKSFASHEKSKYWSHKNNINPRQIFKGSSTKYIFNCNNCNHTFESILSNITIKNTWCPYCVNQKICDNDNCLFCFEKSFASHEKSKYWSCKNKVIPRQVVKGSSTKYLFDCNNCKHEFESVLSYITAKKYTWCPYCANPPQKLCNNINCYHCFENSFASHEKSKYWSHKNEINARDVFKASGKKYWFHCNCGHEFESSLNSITTNNSWCPYCSNKKLCDNDDCKNCFKKSFASHEMLKYWSHKNKVNPRHIFTGSNNKYIFNCDYGHEFKSLLYHVTGYSNKWCPICVNKTEKKLYNKLLEYYPNLHSQFRADWCKNVTTNKYLRFDFVLEEQKIIIELDGPQHFIQISNWNSPEKQHQNDKYKQKCANENGYSVIRIIQEDILYDTYDWLNELRQNIIKIVNEQIVQNIYMCYNNEYINFIN